MNKRLARPRSRWVILATLLAAVSATAWSQTVTSPATAVVVRAAPDYATEVLQDRWDMNERTDLGWRIFNTEEEPLSFLTNISFSGGLFSATTGSDPNIFILDSDYPGTAGLGKFGSNYKIDADKYTVFAIRMYIPSPPGNDYAQLFWTENTIYSTNSWSNPIYLRPGWGIYLVSLPTLGTSSGTLWSGLKDSLRLDPLAVGSPQNIQIDWIRLVENATAYRRTITWSGSGGMDIYLDNDEDPANGNLGLLIKNRTGGSYEFVAGALPSGHYYVAIAPTGTTSFAYSTGYYDVDEQPIFRIDTPSAEGSTQDFMTVVAGNPWDFNALSDVDHTVGIHDASIRAITYEDMAGNTYTDNTVYHAYADPLPGGVGVGDPIPFFLSYAFRGATYKIDTSRYHNLVAKMGIEGVHSTNIGSIARVIYMRADEHTIGENVTHDIIIRHTPLPDGKLVMNKIVGDLRTIPLEDGAASPSHSGWTGTIDSFRLDPHEFPDGRGFFFDDIKITADWRVDASFTIEWTMEDADTPSGATVSFYYDTDRSGYNGTLIQSAISAPAGTGTTVWNTSSVPGGTYYLYAVVTDGANTNRYYATGPVIVDHSGIPQIDLSKSSFIFGAIQNGTATPAETTALTNTGTGTLNWTAARSADWISVSPTSGTGNSILTIGIARTNLWSGVYLGTVTVADPDATNSPRTINVRYEVFEPGSDAFPFGEFSTPDDGVTVRSSIAVTGWALDDIGVRSVSIKRRPINEFEATDPDGLIFIGNATFVRGARNDVAAAYPQYPLADRAGWGYMLLTNFLPNQGNGTFTLVAVAEDMSGHKIWIPDEYGRSEIVIHADNAHATLPFGAIDTPAQGGTASGAAYYNFGWALTPQPNFIPTNGSTIWVWVNGLPLGHPNYGYPRGDIQTLFPGYQNTNTAVGVYTLNTTAYTDGVHNIAWSVQDSAGGLDGIGSRFFSISNLAGGAAVLETSIPMRAGGSGATDLKALSERPIVTIEEFREDLRTPVFVRRGMDFDAPAETVLPETDGSVKIVIPEITRVAVYLNEADSNEREDAMIERGARILNASPGASEKRYEAFQLVFDRLQPLPIGASFDTRDGILYWQPGPGFLGDYVFILVDRLTDTRKSINIKIK